MRPLGMNAGELCRAKDWVECTDNLVLPLQMIFSSSSSPLLRLALPLVHRSTAD